ncbi:MAG: hypothetical protein ACPGSB_09545 [Opitutales bacterium]
MNFTTVELGLTDARVALQATPPMPSTHRAGPSDRSLRHAHRLASPSCPP